MFQTDIEIIGDILDDLKFNCGGYLYVQDNTRNIIPTRKETDSAYAGDGRCGKTDHI